MSLFEETIARISVPDQAARSKAEQNLRSVMPDPSILGDLYPLVLKYIAATGNAEPDLPKKCVIICCADHGIAEEKVSAYPQETTLEMTKNYLVSKGAVANALANFAGAELLVVDLGIASLKEPLEGLINRRIAPGTKNFAKGPAMTREQAIASIEAGIELAVTCARNGVKCFLPGEMGIANTSTSAAINAVLCGQPSDEMTGRGTNISDEQLPRKIAAIKRGIEINHPDPADGLDVLAKVGGFEFGAIAGIILGAAAEGAVVALDGFNTGAAALIAQALCPTVTHYLIGSHLAAEPKHRLILEKLGLVPYMDLKFRLGEATGSSIAVNFLDAAIRTYNSLVRPGRSSTSGCLFILPHMMPPDGDAVPSRILNNYLNDFPSLNKISADGCRNRLNSLAKPIYSLGYLEDIAVELAGITEEKMPPINLSKTLICFSDGTPVGVHGQIMAAFAKHSDAKCLLSILRHDQTQTSAWAYGTSLAEEIAQTDSIIGISMHHPDAPQLKELLTDKGELRYKPNTILEHVPESLKVYVSTITGTILAAAKQRLFIVLDNEPVEIIARYVEELIPAVRPFILHVQPRLITLGITSDAGAIACLGFKLIDASLHILHDMKTFAESNVSVAIDGAGKGKQG